MQQKDARIRKLKAKLRSFRFLEKIFYSVFKIKNYKILFAADEQKREKLNINYHLIGWLKMLSESNYSVT